MACSFLFARGPARRFASFRFPVDVIMVAVRLHLRCGLSYSDVEELLVEPGVAVDHVTVYWWVQTFTPLPAAARFARHSPFHMSKPVAPSVCSRRTSAWPACRAVSSIMWT